jgi:hypothetical protein
MVLAAQPVRGGEFGGGVQRSVGDQGEQHRGRGSPRRMNTWPSWSMTSSMVRRTRRASSATAATTTWSANSASPAAGPGRNHPAPVPGTGPDTPRVSTGTRPGGHLTGPGRAPGRRTAAAEGRRHTHLGPAGLPRAITTGARGVLQPDTMNTTPASRNGLETECTARDVPAGPIAAFAARYRRGDVSGTTEDGYGAQPPEPELSPAGNRTDNRCRVRSWVPTANALTCAAPIGPEHRAVNRPALRGGSHVPPT